MNQEFVIGKYTLESLTSGMYASPLDLYREYIQNAVDSFDDAINRHIEFANKLRIEISISQEDGRITIRDNGCGIKASKAVGTLLDIGNSKKSQQTSRGFRGIGRLAGLSYCDRLTFRTSAKNEEVCTTIEFDAALLKELMLPGGSENETVSDVVDKIVTIRTEHETANRRYFEVILEGVWSEAGLTDLCVVEDYLIQHAPLPFSPEFKWGRTISEKIRMEGFYVPQYSISLNGKELVKPYQDQFISDRVKRNTDTIKDVCVKPFFRGDVLSAVIWYARTSFFGTILDNSIKGIRIRQGNILIGDRTSCNHLFKEERFNGWMIGELHILDPEIIANSRRDGFEKNTAYYELLGLVKEWALDLSKEIRRISYERSLTGSKKAIAEAERIEEITDENSLWTEDFTFADEISESNLASQGESEELAETDYIAKLGLLLDQKKSQTKYMALNINAKLTQEQRRVLERVFDIIRQEYPQETANDFIDQIINGF